MTLESQGFQLQAPWEPASPSRGPTLHRGKESSEAGGS